MSREYYKSSQPESALPREGIILPSKKSVLFPRVSDPSNIFIENSQETVSFEQVLGRTKGRNRVPWPSVSAETVREVVAYVAQSPEVDLPESIIGRTELSTKLASLGGASFQGLYLYVFRHAERNNRSATRLLQDTIGLEMKGDDIIDALRKIRQISWKGFVPQSAATDVIKAFAKALDKPPSMITAPEFDTPHHFFNGNSLKGMLDHSRSSEERGDLDATDFLLNDLGFKKTADDVITLIDKHPKAIIPWKHLEWEEIGKFIELVANEWNIRSEEVRDNRLLRKSFSFMGGRRLWGLVHFLQNHPEKENYETGTGFLRRKLRLISEPPLHSEERGRRPKVRAPKTQIPEQDVEAGVSLVGLTDVEYDIDELSRKSIHFDTAVVSLALVHNKQIVDELRKFHLKVPTDAELIELIEQHDFLPELSAKEVVKQYIREALDQFQEFVQADNYNEIMNQWSANDPLGKSFVTFMSQLDKLVVLKGRESLQGIDFLKRVFGRGDMDAGEEIVL